MGFLILANIFLSVKPIFDKNKVYIIIIAFNEAYLRIVSWCNGSTPGFGPVSQGSNPCETTYKAQLFVFQMVVFFLLYVLIILFV